MRAVIMIIRRVCGKKPLQMARVQSDDVVEQLATAAPHPTLGHSILPRTPHRGLPARDLQGAKHSGYFQAVFLVVIEEQKFWGRFVREGFSELLRDPGAGGMPSDVEMNNLSPVMANNKEAVQQVEGDRRDREKIHGGDHFVMIAKKGLPAPGKSWISGGSLHPAGDAALGYIETQHEQLAVDPGSSPGRIVCHHLEDEIPDLLG